MGLQCTLATLSFADVVQLLGSTRRTGTLHLRKDGAEWRFSLRDGVIVFVSGDATQDPPVGRVLLSLGRIEEDQLEEALERQKTEDKYVGLLLVESGAV